MTAPVTAHVYLPNNDPLHNRILTAFAEGIARTGDDVAMFAVEDYAPSEVAVVFGTFKRAVPYTQFRGRVIAEQRARGLNTVVIDSGYVHRDRYFAAGWNGLNGRADFCADHRAPPERWQALGVALQPWRGESRIDAPIVVCGQVPWDASVQHTDHVEWCMDTVEWLKALAPRCRLIFRPHPKAPQVDYRVGGVEVSNRPLADDLADAHAVVTFNSNSAVEAVIAGVPAFVADRGAMAEWCADLDLRNIHVPANQEVTRLSWAAWLAWTQWTAAEMSAGDAWRHLRRKVRPA